MAYRFSLSGGINTHSFSVTVTSGGTQCWTFTVLMGIAGSVASPV